MKKWFIWVVALLLLAGAAWGCRKSGMCWRQKPVPQEWRRGKPQAWWNGAASALPSQPRGTSAPLSKSPVRPEVNGKIADLPVDIGDRIKKDQVLFTLDDFDLQTERSSRLTDIEADRSWNWKKPDATTSGASDSLPEN